METPVAPPKYHGSHGPGMLLKKLLGPLKLLEFVEAMLEFLLFRLIPHTK